MFADGGMFSVMAYSKAWMQKGKMGPNGEVDKVGIEGIRRWKAGNGKEDSTQETIEGLQKPKESEAEEDDEDEVVEDDD